MAKYSTYESKKIRMSVYRAIEYFEMFNHWTKIVTKEDGSKELAVYRCKEKVPAKTFAIRLGMVTIEDIDSNLTLLDVR
jgi:hypothetical protein